MQFDPQELEDSIVPKYIEEVESLKNEGRYDDAKKKIQDYLVLYTDDYRLYEELADIALYENKLDEAETFMEIATKLEPNSPNGLYLQGYILVSKGNYKEGVKLLQEANNLFPNNSEILRNLGWAQVMLGNAPRGIPLLRRALVLAPEDPLIMEDLGVSLIETGDWKGGELYLHRAGRDDRIEELRLSRGFSSHS